ncbi:MAG TPA: tRNA uridine-5-carboxymethylaminomethyl(34) synthesis GTPase MnmE [Candidatus Eisenbacteria bacterium]|nr:tRNA uridine-5-carboxymethylaminomethyl(34) synthesis GTPase MnmE [Candidatus Eisenbacteria bacterium]
MPRRARPARNAPVMAMSDTIVAIATASGDAAIAITRLSGPDAVAIAARCFRGARDPARCGTHRILFGRFVVGDAPLDTVLLSVFRAPHSYTGEDVVEISSHGGPAVPRAIFEGLIAAGARAARPGEFTERAYRNGKLDLAQAEAVASIVRARSERSLRAAHATLGGDLTRRIEALDAELISISAEVESRLDFPGDVREAAEVAALGARCEARAAEIREWVERLPAARRREEGVRVALIGAPNVGKSSLLNALVGYDRAIVNESPGTTRDTVEASIWLDGVEIRLSDTAGMRETGDPVERLGVERSERAAAAADLTLVVRDCSAPEAGAELCERWIVKAVGPVIEVWNKSDLGRPGAGVRGGRVGGVAVGTGAGGPAGATAAAAVATPAKVIVETVAIQPGGVDALIAATRAALPSLLGDLPGEELPATSARQERLLRDAASALERAAAQLRAPIGDVAYDLAAVDLTEARRALGEMVGRGVDDAVVAAIFSRFCIGK